MYPSGPDPRRDYAMLSIARDRNDRADPSDRSRRRRPRRRVGSLWLLLVLGATAASVLLFMGARTPAAAARQSAPAHSRASTGPPAPRTIAVRSRQLPLGLNPGACTHYPSSKDQKNPIVFIDPGHGGPDPGAQGVRSDGTPVYEKTVSLAVAQALTERLRRDGYGVVLSRTGDYSVARLSDQDVNGNTLSEAGVRLDTIARIACANASGANALVAIHFNAFGGAAVGGSETYYDDARPFTSQNQRLATQLQQSLIARFHRAGWPVPDRGIQPDSETGAPALTKEGAAYGHLLELGPAQSGWIDEPSSMPGVLVEPLFLTRPSEADVASTSSGQQTMAAGLADGLEAFLTGH